MDIKDNNALRQWIDEHPELREKIATLSEERKPTTAAEIEHREREKLLAEEYRLYVEEKGAEMQTLYQSTKAESDIRHADRPYYNGLDYCTTSQLKAELRRRKGKKPLD